MERELVMTGMGGQGVQLASSVLASAALADGREVQLFGSYGGMMRGGATESTLVVGDEPISSPPTVGAAWSVIVMHHEYSEHAMAALRPGGVAFVNTTVADVHIHCEDIVLVEVPATAIAIDQGNAMAASMVMLGAYVTVTSLVTLSSLAGAARSALPPYRSQHIELNDRAISAGAAAAGTRCVPAWSGAVR
jgi:Pyruvate/2-oxoacid:ferredoxin oxidoreductase gamma subunit